MLAACTVGALAWTASGSFEDALLFMVMATATAACVHMLIGTYEEPSQWASLVGSSVLWGAAGCGLIGLATIGNGLGLAIAAPLAILSPPVVDALFKSDPPRARQIDALDAELAPDVESWTTRTLAAPPCHFSDPPWMTQPLADLDVAALCLAWRASYVALQQQQLTSSRLRIVQRRQAILDDLQRRNPPGVAAWLASGARAAGDPAKYLGSAHRRTWGRAAPHG